MSSDRHHYRTLRRVTSIDVAREAEVSQATVSRAFSAPHSVSEEKRQRVYAAAERLGYHPNAIARSLSSASSRIVGVVVPADSVYYEHMVTRMARHLAPLDYQVLLFEYEIGTDLGRVLRAVRSYQVDALVVSAMIIDPSAAASLQASGVPVLMFNYQGDEASLPSMSVDADDGMAQLARHLLDTGHNSIVFAGGPRSSHADRLRYRAAAEALAAGGVPCRYVETGEFTYDAGLATAARLLAAEPRPDAVMAASDAIAFGVIDGLRAAGVAVPGDVSVTGFDGLPQAAWKAYDLTTVEQPVDELVGRASRWILSALGGDEPVPLAERTMPGVLRLRGTVADRRVRNG